MSAMSATQSEWERGSLDSYSFEVGQGKWGGYGLLAMAVWCAVARKVRSTALEFKRWSDECGATLYHSQKGTVVHSASRGWSKWPLDIDRVVQSIVSDHNAFIRHLVRPTTNAEHVYFGFELPRDPRNDTPFEDMCRFWINNDGIMDRYTTWVRPLAINMITQTLCNKWFVVVCDAERNCRVVWKEFVAKDWFGNPDLQLYPFRGYEDVEDVRTRDQLLTTPPGLFMIPTRVGDTTEFSRYTHEYRRREVEQRSKHSLWSFAQESKRSEQETLVCGGVANFVNHQCDDVDFKLKTGRLWSLHPVAKQPPSKPGQEVFLSYLEGSTKAHLHEILGGACACGICDADSLRARPRMRDPPDLLQSEESREAQGVLINAPLEQTLIERMNAMAGEKVVKQIKRLYDDYARSGSSQSLRNKGSTTAIRFGSLFTLLERMELTPDSVLLDIGCGSGFPSIVAAKLWKCTSYGFDVDEELVDQAEKNARRLGVADRCIFGMMDVMDLTSDWLKTRKITHVYWFDKVFPVEAWNHTADVLSEGKTPTIKVIADNYNDSFAGYRRAEGDDIVSVSMSPSGEGKTFYIQRQEAPTKPELPQEPEEEDSDDDVILITR